MSVAYSQPVWESAPRVDALGYLRRSPLLPLTFVPATVICGLSWAFGGLPLLTDLGFVVLTVTAGLCLFAELRQFPRRFGIGGLVLFGGVLLWFCLDYLQNWFLLDFAQPNVPISAEIVAKTACFHGLFIIMMTAGLLLPVGRGPVKLFQLIPEPTTPDFYLWLILITTVIGLSPYVLFTENAWYEAIFLSMTAGRGGQHAAWTVGRSDGNLNTNWGAYIAFLIDIGKVGGQLAAFYAVLIARSPITKGIAWFIWAVFLGLAFGHGARGAVLFVGLPVMALLFLKYQAQTAALLRRISKRAYLTAGAGALVLLLLVQIQGQFRSGSFRDANLHELKVMDIKGTTMFSEGLIGWSIIPAREKFFYDKYPGQALVSPLPHTLFQFAVGPIPRALWKDKWVDPAWEWMNRTYLGTLDGTRGTTISQGMVGHWYFRFGLWGVIEGGLLIGWLMVLSERALQCAEGRPMRIMLSLAFATFLFRSFRGLNFHNLYPLMIGALVLLIIISVQRSLSGAPRTQPATSQPIA